MYQTTATQRRVAPVNGPGTGQVGIRPTTGSNTGNNLQITNPTGSGTTNNINIGNPSIVSNQTNSISSIASRVPEMLDQVKVEFETVLQQLNIQRIDRDDIEQKVRNQINEVTEMTQQFRNLEALHRRLKMQYEEDIARLRHQLEQATQQQSTNNSGSTTGNNTTQQGTSSFNLHQTQVNRPGSGRISTNNGRNDEINNLPKLLPSNRTSNVSGVSSTNTSSISFHGQGSPLRLASTNTNQQNLSNTTNISIRRNDESDNKISSLNIQSSSNSSSNNIDNHLRSNKRGTDPSSNVAQPLKRLNTGIQDEDTSSSIDHHIERKSNNTCDQDDTIDSSNTSSGVLNSKEENTDDITNDKSSPSKSYHENSTTFLQKSVDINVNSTDSPKSCKIENETIDSVSTNISSENTSRHPKVKWTISYNTRSTSYPETDRPHVVKKYMLDHQSVVCCVRFSSDGTRVASGCHKTAQVYDVSTGRQVFTVTRPNLPTSEGEDAYVRAVCFSPDGTKLVAGMPQNTIRIWDISTHEEVQKMVGHESEIYSLDYVNDLIASGSGDRKVKLWDVRKGTCHTTFGNDVSGPSDGVTSVALSPDGQLLAAASLDKVIRIWDTSTSQLVDKLEGHSDSVYSIAFSPDGKNVISGSLDRTLMLWDVSSSGRTTSRPRLLFQGHKDFVLSVAYTPDGRWLMSGSKDRTVVFWDPRSTRSVLTVSGYRNSVISVASSPATPHFATGSGDCFACIWDYQCQNI